MSANKIGPDQRLVSLGPRHSEQAAARAPRTEYVVVSRSDELLEQLGQVLDGSGEVRHADNEEEARQFLDPRHATVMLLDAREHVDAGLAVERLHASDGTTVIVLFAPAAASEHIARAIKGSAAFAVLPIPIEVAKTRAVLHGAGEEALARRALVSQPLEPPAARTPPESQPREPDPAPQARIVEQQPVVSRSAVPAEPEPRIPPPVGGGTGRESRVPRAAVAAVVALVAVATAAWLFLRNDPEEASGVVADAGAPPVAPDPTVASDPAPAIESRPAVKLSTEPKEALLDRARAAFHERRYTDPQGDNALHYYRSVLAQDPQNGEALEGLNRIGKVLDGRLKSALAENRHDDAARTLELLRTIRPDDAAVAAAAAQLTEQRVGAALARGDVEQATSLLQAADRAGIASQQLTQLRDQLARLERAQRAERLSQLVSTRIRDGQLLSPPGDSAKHYLDQLLKLPNGKRLGAVASDELARALAERARRAAAQGQGAEAERMLAEAKALGYTPERPLVAVTASGAAEQGPPRQGDAPASIRHDVPAMQIARPATPEPVAGTESGSANRSAAPAAEAEVSAADFKRTRYVAPTYPPQALTRGVSGEVRVRLLVDGDGRVADVQVLSANPAGVFDQAAISAVRKWRFKPIVRDGRAIEASVTTTISFQPDQAAKR